MLKSLRHSALSIASALLLISSTARASIFSVEEKSFASYVFGIINKASSNYQSFVYPWVVCKDAKKEKKATFLSGPIYSPNERNLSREMQLLRWLGGLINEADLNQVDFALCSMQIDHFDVCLSQAAFTISFENGYIVGYEEIFSNHECNI